MSTGHLIYRHYRANLEYLDRGQHSLFYIHQGDLMLTQKKQILFFVESVSLAHTTRSLALANSLDKNKFKVTFAIFELQEIIKKEFAGYKVIPLQTGIRSKVFIEALSRGKLPHTDELLERNIEEAAAYRCSVRFRVCRKVTPKKRNE
jgi:hypothetical protein